jgi:5'-3' exonuclease
MHIPIEVKGFEADDLIGTIANKLKKKTTKSLW